MEEEEDDIVVKEFPVILCSTEKDCFLFQYPLEAKPSKSVVSSVKNVYAKPIQKKFQLQVVPDEEEQKDKLNYVNLESSMCSHRANYAFAQWTGSALLLKPIEGILQFRPLLSSVGDKGDTKVASLLQDTTVGRWLEDSTEEEPEVIGVQFRRRETPKAAAWKRSSYHYQKMLRDEEPWEQLQYSVSNEVGFMSESSSGNRLSTIVEQSPCRKPQTANFDSMTMMIPQWITMMDDTLGNKQQRIENVVQDIPQRVYEYLYQHRVVELSSLIKLFSEDSLSVVWRALCEYGILVNHVWALKSEYISQWSKMEQCCRDIILEMFSSQDYVKTSTIRERLFYVGEGIWKKILEEIGIHYKGLGWRLKTQGENSLGHLFHPFVIQQQKYLHERVEASIEYLQSLYNNHSSYGKGESLVPLLSTTTTHTSLTNPTREVVANSITTSRNEHLRRWLFIFIKKNGTVSYNMVYSQAKKDCLSLLDCQQETQWKSVLNGLLNEMCVQIRGCFILKQLNNPSVDKYRNAILKLFMQHTKLKKSDINKALEENFLSISNSMYNTILREFATFKDQSWHLKEPPF